MKRPPPPNPLAMKAAVDDFNARYVPGTIVKCWTGVMHDGEPKIGAVREPGAYILSGHTPVVHIEGVSGCVSLSHVRAA